MTDKTDNQAQETTQGNLGTFSGVFTPSILTILGIILFLRHGHVVGSAGLQQALIIIGVANLISILTSFSLAAIATNLKVKGGGDYYLISRTLGVAFGGALGLVLFLAQSVSIAFYCIGFGESLTSIFPHTPWLQPQLVAATAVLFLFLLAWIGADLATRFQYVVMGFLILALASFYIGGFVNWDSHQLIENWQKPSSGENFWILFALFFPAVTGFTQGVSMSGELKDPGKSLPLGTFLAVAVSIVVYISVTLIFAASRPLSELSSNYQIMGDIAVLGSLITAGVIAATLSSAMASFLGAPRILQALASDKVFPLLNPFAKGSGKANNPRKAVLLSAVIAMLTIGLGQLDIIARVVSMFFLISYGLLNYATYFEARAASPSFRPRFRWYHPYISMAGFLSCLGVMLAIDIRTGVAAIAILFALYEYIKKTAGPARWADSQRSKNLQLVRTNLLAAGSESDHPRDWRPYLLAFSQEPDKLEHLLQFAAWIEGGSGITTVAQLLTGEDKILLRQRQEAGKELRHQVRQFRGDAFSLVVSGENTTTTLATLLQSYGIGPVRANTILLNWAEHQSLDMSSEDLRIALRLGCHLIIFHGYEKAWQIIEQVPENQRRIDVWWNGDETARLMLLLAYLITRNNQWDEAAIRVLATNYSEDNQESQADLGQTLEATRIHCSQLIVTEANQDQIAELASKTAISFMPLHFDKGQPVDFLGNSSNQLLKKVGITALVKAGQEVDLDAEPEEGTAGTLAQSLDGYEKAEQRVKAAEKAAEKALKRAEQKMTELIKTDGKLDDQRAEKLQAVLKARREAEAATRKAKVEQVKSETAAREAEALGAEIDKDEEGSL